MTITEGWVGANSEEQARRLVENKFPGCTIHKLYQKISGMWSFEVTEADHIPFQEATQEVLEEKVPDPVEEPFDEEPPEEEPEGLEKDVL